MKQNVETPAAPPTPSRPLRASLIVVGSFATGKTTTCELLSQLTGAPYVDMGTLVQKEAASHGFDLLTHAANQFAENNLAFMESVVNEGRAQGIPCIVAGLRRVDQLNYLKLHLAPAFSIALTLPDDERWRRLTRRRFTENPEQEWTERKALEEEWGIANTLAECDAQLSTTAPAEIVAEECLNRWLAFDVGEAIARTVHT